MAILDWRTGIKKEGEGRLLTIEFCIEWLFLGCPFWIGWVGGRWWEVVLFRGCGCEGLLWEWLFWRGGLALGSGGDF